MMKYKAQPKPDIVHRKKKQLEWRLAIRNLIDLWTYHQRNLSHESSTAQNINPSVCSAERNEEERTKDLRVEIIMDAFLLIWVSWRKGEPRSLLTACDSTEIVVSPRSDCDGRVRHNSCFLRNHLTTPNDKLPVIKIGSPDPIASLPPGLHSHPRTHTHTNTIPTHRHNNARTHSQTQTHSKTHTNVKLKPERQ